MTVKRLSLLILTVGALLLSSLSALAQEEMTAEMLLDRLSEKLYFYGGTRFDYHLVYDNKMEHDGTVIQKGKKAYYTNSTTQSWDNGTTRWVYTPSLNTVTVAHSQQEPQNTGGDEAFGYLRVVEALTMESELSLKDKSDCYLLTVRPAKASPYQQILKVEIAVDKTTFYPKEIEVRIRTFIIRYTIKNFQCGNFDDSVFEFKQVEHPGVIVQKE